MKSALVIVDVQNDFCSSGGAGFDVRKQREITYALKNIKRALEIARSRQLPIIWVQYLGDKKYIKTSLAARNQRQVLPAKCIEGTWGASFVISPGKGEKIIKKEACFDAFFNKNLEEYLIKNKIKSLIFAGFFADICVDATARTAFQKGYYIKILTDCTVAFHYILKKYFDYIKKLYGAENIRTNNLQSI